MMKGRNQANTLSYAQTYTLFSIICSCNMIIINWYLCNKYNDNVISFDCQITDKIVDSLSNTKQNGHTIAYRCSSFFKFTICEHLIYLYLPFYNAIHSLILSQTSQFPFLVSSRFQNFMRMTQGIGNDND